MERQTRGKLRESAAVTRRHWNYRYATRVEHVWHMWDVVPYPYALTPSPALRRQVIKV